MRIVDGKDEVRYGKIEEIDEKEINKIHDSIERIRDINKDIWSIVEENSFPR
jgi:hypothetical protein